jgi:hypothetical protein
MLGKKINEFENTDGTVKSFNKIFPRTPLDLQGCVEILEISDTKSIFTQNLFVRDINVNGEIFSHDFGRDNFSEDSFSMEEKIRFKYYAKDLNGNLLATAYNIKDLAEKLNCGIAIVKNRLIHPINENFSSKHLFNVTRKEL